MKGFSISASNYEQTVCKILKRHPGSFKHGGQIARHNDNNTVCENSCVMSSVAPEEDSQSLIKLYKDHDDITIMKSEICHC